MNDGIKLMIVDDEALIRNLLRQSIPWEALGVCAIKEAENAEQAMEDAGAFHPDLVITDICMTDMDGITLADALIRHYPGVKVVILTGYNEFAYAKRSISAGVSEFLLKPINPKEIRRVVLRIKEEIVQERAHVQEWDALKEQLKKDKPYARLAFLQKLLLNQVQPDELAAQLDYFGFDFTQSCFQVAALSTAKNVRDSEEARQLLRIKCLRTIEHYLEGKDGQLAFLDVFGRIVLLSYQYQVDLEHSCRHILQRLEQEDDIIAHAGVGNAYERVEDMMASYQQAVEALDYAAFSRRPNTVCYDEVAYSVTSETQLKNGLLGKYEFYLKAGLEQRACECAGEILRQAGDSIDDIRVAASRLVTSAMDVVASFGLAWDDVMDKPTELFPQLFSIPSARGITALIWDITAKIAACQRQQTMRRDERLTERIQDYIRKNMGNDELSLTVTADAFHLSTGYLSRILKKETGMNFVKFLLKTRMEQAALLLKTTELLGYQVGAAVGIPDSHYFSICFKKYAGMSVSDYKKECRSKI